LAQSTGGSLLDWNRDFDQRVGRKEFEFRIVPEHQYDAVDSECVLYPDLDDMRREVKWENVTDNRTLFEQWVTWYSSPP
jgi:hypothetical protein